MSIEPKYPKVLKQKLIKRQQQGTMSTKNICCGGFYESHSPDRSVQNIPSKENKLFKMFTDTTEARIPRREMKSVNNVERHQAVSRQKPFIDRQIVNYTRVNQLSFVPLQKDIKNRRIVQSTDKQKLYYLSQINELQRKVAALQTQNIILRQKQQLYGKMKAENNQLTQMYNTKLHESETLKKSLNYIHQTVLRQPIENKFGSTIKSNDQQKEQILTNNSQWFKDFSITDHQRPSKRNSFSNPFTNHHQSSMKYSTSISKFQQSSLPTPQLSLQDQMKKLRSVYQKSDSKSSLNISPQTQLMEITRIPEFNFDQIISQIQQIHLDGISVSVEDIRDDLTYSNVIKRLQDYTEIGNDKKKLFE